MESGNWLRLGTFQDSVKKKTKMAPDLLDGKTKHEK